ncbi:(-)-kolavenyl diphosphate synthase TPS28, chloroplastic-like isoform X2 [Tasmannia lanceolata]|uniref:(-)-kolavenyl diphosphate synthase TPS28, chloroplastic-like isoform X2 n=1 Tax=Tasmannia lanceolata TaxID=3420 RepID=UPI00406428ED
MISPPNLIRPSTPAPSFVWKSQGFFSSVFCYRAGWKQAEIRTSCSRCSGLAKPRVMQGTFRDGLSIIELPEVLHKVETEEALSKALESREMRQQIDVVKAILRNMGDGEITVSAYDTAWVALVEDIHGSGAPQFPSSLEWIVKNQLIDGSWGDRCIFSAHDRIISTLACVIALKSWNIYPQRCQKGMSFLQDNIGKLKEENAEHMPIGFEVAFPSLIEIARSLDLDVPLDSSVLQDIYAKRNLKLERYWTDDGISWARNSRVHDVDDTAMAFRLLRLHGYKISAEAFKRFKSGNEFFCFVGQTNPAVTGIYNLNRASHFMFPGESILEDARRFSYKFLREKQASNQLLDKWIITKDLPGEVGYTLDFPWYASLPRIETRFYLEQYGGDEDVWIGKTLYRMPYVNNNAYLELAKSDFNKCQMLHQLEWLEIQNWYDECNLGEFGLSKRRLLRAYFLAAASIFEPEKATERVAWARTTVLMEAVSSYIGNQGSNPERRRAFLDEFNNKRWGRKKTRKGVVGVLLDYLFWKSLVAHDRDVRYHLRSAWASWWKMTCESHPDKNRDALLLVRTIDLFAGRSVSQDLLADPVYARLAHLTNRLSHQLRRIRKLKEAQVNDREDANNWLSTGAQPIESEMQEIMHCVLQNSDGLDCEIKQTFLTVAKSLYYSAYCSPEVFDLHINKVLFERVA